MSEYSQSAKSPFVLLTSLGILVIATLVVASTYFLRPGIEYELKEKLLHDFANAGFVNTSINVSGRDVTLRGNVQDKAEALKAENTAKQIWGIRQVDNQLLIKNQSVE